MGLLDTILGSVLGNNNAGAPSPMAGVMGQMLGGGGLGTLLGQLRQGGLGSHVDSWVGNGDNQPASPQQLGSALGPQQVSSWASQAGMQPNDFLSQLSQHLPNVVNQMSPNGRLPDEGTVSV